MVVLVPIASGVHPKARGRADGAPFLGSLQRLQQSRHEVNEEVVILPEVAVAAVDRHWRAYREAPSSGNLELATSTYDGLRGVPQVDGSFLFAIIWARLRPGAEWQSSEEKDENDLPSGATRRETHAGVGGGTKWSCGRASPM